jgi:gluconate 2-dehydrogenase gamma chain
MNRRDLFRQTFLGAAAAATAHVATAREFPSDYDASKELARADWKPLFLDDHQNETLVVFSDMLIPATDTPGAKVALVNRFIDAVLAVETHETQRSFLDSLAFLDGESFARHRAAFVYLSPEQRTELLTFMAYPHTLETWDENAPGSYRGHTHFNTLKNWISRAYYSSPVGMQALGYTGAPGGLFEGCEIASRAVKT